MENPIKMDDLGVPLFLETPMYTFQVVDASEIPAVANCEVWYSECSRLVIVGFTHLTPKLVFIKHIEGNTFYHFLKMIFYCRLHGCKSGTC